MHNITHEILTLGVSANLVKKQINFMYIYFEAFFALLLKSICKQRFRSSFYRVDLAHI